MFIYDFLFYFADYVHEIMDCVMDLRQRRASYKVAKYMHLEEDRSRPLPLAHSTPKRNCMSKKDLVNSHISRFNNL